MSGVRGDSTRGEPNDISRVDYPGYEGRIIRLEEWRNSHNEMHAEHVATHEWVYKVGFAVVTVIATVAATIAAAVVGALFT